MQSSSEEEKMSKKNGSMGIGQIIAYTFGGMFVTMSCIGDQFGLFFMTDIAGVNAAAAGSILSVATIVGSFMDPIVGGLVDNTHTRMGKYRPWLIIGGVAMAILMMLRFTTCPIEGDTGKVIFYGAVTLLFVMSFSAVCVPWQGMISDITMDYNSRNILVAARAISGACVGNVIPMIIMQSIEKLGGGIGGWTKFVVIAMSMGYCAVLFCQWGVRDLDRPTEKPAKKVSASGKEPAEKKEGFNLSSILGVLKSKPVLFLTLAMVLNNGIFTLGTVVEMHFYKYILNDLSVLAKAAAVTLPITIICSFLLPFVLAKIDKRTVIIAAAALNAVKPLYIMLCHDSLNTNVVIALVLLQRVGLQFFQYSLYALVPDCVDFTKWKFNLSAAALISSIVSFGQRFSRALGQGVAGWLLGLAGYVQNSDVQCQSALDAIINMSGIIQVVGLVLVVLPIIFFPISRKLGDQIREELQSGKKSGETA